jgi:hypothetical protein
LVQKSSRNIDRIRVIGDDPRAVANAGLILPATLARKLGIEALANECIDLGDRPGHFRPGRKIMTLVHSMIAGGSYIDDADVLRSASTEDVLGHRVMAPSTLGTFLRSFTFGNLRQLDRLCEQVLHQAWSAGAGPGDEPMTIDIDSTICEVYGKQKQGAAYGYTKVLGLHPLAATRAGTGEILHMRMRKGSAGSARGAGFFVKETFRRVRRCGSAGPLTLRADSAFFSHSVVDTCVDNDMRFSITVDQNPAVVRLISEIDEESWIPIGYTEDGIAQVAETIYWGHRLIVRRTKVNDPKVLALFPDWRHHAFITDRQGTAIELDEDHRRHAVVELVIRDVKEGAGLEHCPSGNFWANGAWLAMSVLAHNLMRWVAKIGAGNDDTIVVKTMRNRLFRAPGRMTKRGRERILHLPENWPWVDGFLEVLANLRAIRLVT